MSLLPFANSNSDKVGSLVSAFTSPGSDYLKANGQVLSQASYPVLYSQLGTQPDFDITLKTITPSFLISIAYSSSLGLYVAILSAVGSNLLYSSTDLKNWNSVNMNAINASFTPTSIAWCSGLGMFIITSGGPNVITSTDGINWITSEVFADAGVSYVCASATTIVVGGNSDLDNSINHVYTSTDGVNWTRRTISTVALTITAMHYSVGMSLYVVGGSAGNIYTSTDGITWNSRTSNISSQINQFDSYASLIVAVGNSGVISSSPEGTNWTARTTQTTRALSGVAYSPTATIPWIAVGTLTIMTSTNGTTWVTLAETLPGKSNIFWSGSDYCETGAAWFVATSTDLTTWTGQTAATSGLAGNAMNTGAYGNGAYVIAGAAGKIDSSANGTSWTNRTANAGSNILNHVIYWAGSVNLFVVVGAGNIINTSPDGSAWTARTATGTFNAVAAKTGTDVAVAVGNAGVVYSSTNGTAWTSRTSNTGFNLTGVAWNGTIFCAVGANGTVITSSDGTTWTKQSPTTFGTNNISWITSDGSNFYAITSVANQTNFVFISSDGITWTMYSSPLPLQSINYMNSKLVGYTALGDIATSTNGQTWSVVANSRGMGLYQKAYWLSPNFYIPASSFGISTSTNGQIFQNLYGTGLNGIAYSASQTKLVAVGNGGAVLTSTDSGTTWTPQYAISNSDTTNSNLTDIAYSPSLDLFVTVSFKGYIYSSSDGATWTQRSFTSSHFNDYFAGSGFQSIVWSVDKAMFVAVGSNGIIATSTNGTTWTERSSGNNGITLSQVVYNSALALFVAVGNKNGLITSTNGTTWTPRLSGLALLNNFTSVVSLESLGFVAVSSSSLARSVDGITWKQIGSTDGVSKGLYSSVDSSAFLPGINAVSTTNDGLTNLSTFLGASGITFNAIAYDSGADKYITVGASSTPAGTWEAILTRTYNKATQFVLPKLTNTWIKVR